MSAAQRILGMVDHTSLGDHDTEAEVRALCAAAATAHGPVAAVCVWPQFAALASELMAASAVKVAAVANFPAGTAEVSEVVAEALALVAAGVDEIDVVCPWQAHLDGDHDATTELLIAVREAVGHTIVIKAILETGELPDAAAVNAIARAAVIGGADILKTSTGKTAHGADFDAARVLLNVIADAQRNGATIGLKISGAIRDVDTAAQYLALADEVMGESWATPETMRFGASSLLADVVTLLDSPA